MDESNAEMFGLGRRQVLKLFGLGLASVGGTVALADCSKGAEQAAVPTPKPAGSTGGLCQLKVPVDEAARQMRRTVQYLEVSNQPGRQCSNCSQFLPAKFGECGGCSLFDGGVSPGGMCLSYLAIAAPDAGGKAG